MDRNTVLAFALSMIVFVTYVMYQEQRRMEHALELEAQAQAQAEATAEVERGAIDRGPGAERSEATAIEREPAEAETVGRPGEELPDVLPLPRRRDVPLETITLRNDDVVVELTNGPAMIEGWRLNHFMERLPEGEIPIQLLDDGLAVLATDVDGVSGARFAQARYEIVRQGPREVVQRAVDEAGVLTRTFRLDPEGYGFDLELEFESRRRDPVDARFEVQLPARVSQRRDFRELSLVAWAEQSGVTREFVQGIGQPGFLSALGFGNTYEGYTAVEGRRKWAGFDVQYFAGLVIDPSDRSRLDVRFETLDAGESAVARVKLPSISVGAGGEAKAELRGFFGPKTVEALAAAGSGASLEHSVDRGWSWLEPLTRFFEIALDKLYVVIPNYGFAIIVLTILVRIVTAPLMVRQMRSAERMREVQPKLKALQERYKDDRQKQSEEMMKLYREEGINPLGGCLPLLLQMPVLIGLFYALRTSIGLRHAPFILWIDDLSQPATLFTIPGLDFPVRVLPLIMGASMYVQQKMMPQTGMDPVQARMMLIMMPGMMLLISYTFPSGLVLYWTVSNLLGIAHQYWVRNHMQPKS